MARMTLRCICGYFVSAQESQAEVLCPACRRPIQKDGPALVPAAQPPASAPPPKPATTRKQIETVALSGKMIGIIAGAAGVLIVGVIVLIVVLSSTQSNAGKHAYNDPDVPTASSSLPLTTPIRRATPGSVTTGKTPAPDAPNYVPQPKPLGSAVTSAPPATPPATPPTTPPLTPATPAAGPGPAVGSSGLIAMPPDLIAKAGELMNLPSFYKDLCMTPGERARAEGLAKTWKGTADDAQFLVELLRSPKIRPCQDDMALIKDTLAKSEKNAVESLPTDVIVLQNGQSLIGRIIDELPDSIRLERRLQGGVGGMMNIKREDIKLIQKGKGIGSEFAKRWETASKGSQSDLVTLMGWCKENNLGGQAKLVAFRILSDEPGYLPARNEASLPADPVRSVAEAMAQGGFISYEGRQWAPKDLRDHLNRQGFVAMNGAWYVKREKIFSVPSLQRYEKQKDRPVAISATVPICQETEMSWRSATVPGDPSRMQEIVEYKPVRSFYAPAMSVIDKKTGGTYIQTVTQEGQPISGKTLSGEVMISVPVGQPIIDGMVRTMAETKHDGTITVSLMLNGERIKMYDCRSKEDSFHELPSVIRGQSSVELVATITMTAAYTAKREVHSICPLKEIYDQAKKARVITMYKCETTWDRQIPDYHAMLFPSAPTTNEVFQLKAYVAEPATGLTKLYADIGATDLLKPEPVPGK